MEGLSKEQKEPMDMDNNVAPQEESGRVPGAEFLPPRPLGSTSVTAQR